MFVWQFSHIWKIGWFKKGHPFSKRLNINLEGTLWIAGFYVKISGKNGKKHSEKETRGALASALMLYGRKGFQSLARVGVGEPSLFFPALQAGPAHLLSFLSCYPPPHSLHTCHSRLCPSKEKNRFLLQSLSICSFLCLECSPSRFSRGWLLPIVQISAQTSSLRRAFSKSITKVYPTPAHLYHNILFYFTYGTYLVYLFILLPLLFPLECKLQEPW